MPRPPIEKIDRDPKGRETHPAFGLVEVLHTSGYQRLFESPFPHQHYVTLRIHEAFRSPGLVEGSEKYVSPGARIVEIALSELQYASLISRPNCGNGIPCTIISKGVKHVPELPEETNRQEEHSAQVKRQVAAVGANLKKSIAALREFQTGKARPTLKELDALLSKFDAVQRDLLDNLPFIHQLFEQAADKTVATAKLDVLAFMETQLLQAGLPQSAAPLALGVGGEESFGRREDSGTPVEAIESVPGPPPGGEGRGGSSSQLSGSGVVGAGSERTPGTGPDADVLRTGGACAGTGE